MTTMISEVFDAFRSAGVPEDKARKAAEALSNGKLKDTHLLKSRLSQGGGFFPFGEQQYAHDQN